MRHIALAAAVAMGTIPSLGLAQSTTSVPVLRVLSSNGVRAPLEDVKTAIEAAIGRRLDVEFSTAAALASRIEAGEPFDVAILTPALIDRLAAGGSVAPEPRSMFARTGVGVGARRGEVSVDISAPDGFEMLLLAAESVTFTEEGQSRRTIDAALERLDIEDAVMSKAVLLGPGEAPFAVAAGDAELVLTLISEILPVPGIELVGAFPQELQGYVSFAAAISPRRSGDPGARAFLDQLAGPAMSAALSARGLEPLSP